MDKEKMIELYLKGYEDGLTEAWRSAKSMVSRYDGWELKSRMKGKISTLYQDVSSKRYKIELDPSVFLPEEDYAEVPGDTLELPEIKKGEMYLFLERKPKDSFNFFFKSIPEAEKGLCITSERIENIIDKYGEYDVVSYCNLAKSNSQRNKSYETISFASLSRLGTVIGEFFKDNPGSILLFQGMDRMIHYNDFSKLQKFVDFIRDKASDNNGYIIVTIPPNILEEKKFNRFRNLFDGEYVIDD